MPTRLRSSGTSVLRCAVREGQKDHVEAIGSGRIRGREGQVRVGGRQARVQVGDPAAGLAVRGGHGDLPSRGGRPAAAAARRRRIPTPRRPRRAGRWSGRQLGRRAIIQAYLHTHAIRDWGAGRASTGEAGGSGGSGPPDFRRAPWPAQPAIGRTVCQGGMGRPVSETTPVCPKRECAQVHAPSAPARHAGPTSAPPTRSGRGRACAAARSAPPPAACPARPHGRGRAPRARLLAGPSASGDTPPSLW